MDLVWTAFYGVTKPFRQGDQPREFVLSDARTQLPPAATWDFETPAYALDFSDALTFVRHSGAK